MNILALAPLGHAPRGAPSLGTKATRGRAKAARLAGASILALSLACAFTPARAAADDNDYGAAALRAYIALRVGGLQKLQVPARDVDLPVPRNADGAMIYRYKTSEAKRYLGKLIFHDPVRTVRIDKNNNQPADLPAGTAFGGTESAANPNIQDVVRATRQTGSCGSCHIGEAAGKAGQVLNFNVGGEGRGYTDEAGRFFPRRRPQSILTKHRSAPIFAGDALVDVLPTLTDIDLYERGSRARHRRHHPGQLLPHAGAGLPAADRPARRAGQRGTQLAVDGRRRVQQPPAAGRLRWRAAVRHRLTQPVQGSGAGEPDAAAARRAPDAELRVSRCCNGSPPS